MVQLGKTGFLLSVRTVKGSNLNVCWRLFTQKQCKYMAAVLRRAGTEPRSSVYHNNMLIYVISLHHTLR